MLRFKSLAAATAGALISLAFAVPAYAQGVPTTVGARVTAGIYSFDVSNGSIFATGLVTTDSTGHATGISGLVDGTDPITGLSSYAGADNDLYAPPGAWVTFAGLSFSTLHLGDFNYYNSGLGHYGFLSSQINVNGYPDGQIATAHVAAVPEPTSWAMMLLGFGAASLAMRLNRRKMKVIPQVA